MFPVARHGLWTNRLFFKSGDPVRLIDRENAKPASLSERNPHRRHRDVGTGLAVGPQHRRVIHPVNVIAGENDDKVRSTAFDQVEVLVNRVGRSLIP